MYDDRAMQVAATNVPEGFLARSVSYRVSEST